MLKLNIVQDVNGNQFASIQIQHLLKLNNMPVVFALPSAENSNTTLVKVKYGLHDKCRRKS